MIIAVMRNEKTGIDVRLIDADKMKEDLLTVDPRYESMIQWCITVLDAQPTIEPKRKTGKWTTKSTNGEMFDVCSVCGYVEWDNPKNFCPNCGADMRGEQDG